MVNFQERVLTYPQYCKQFSCGDSLITIFNCPPEARLMKDKFADLWSHENYIFYVLEGKKVWHTAHGSYEIGEGSCVLVRKGACILEQFFDIGFCLVLFFIPDQFICETLRNRSVPIANTGRQYNSVIPINVTDTLRSFFVSMYAYFSGTTAPDQSLLELKFRELILNIADNRDNAELLSYFCSMMNEPQSVSLERVMHDNYCFNLKLEQYAALCNRSLSAFKRDFQKQFHTSPGKWLLEKRLQQSMALLKNRGKSVAETAFESGFENSSHFSRSFKQRFGMSPMEARQTLVL
ncbi:helix-turn-helix transcriptional regulator [Lacibacter sp. H407]|uniref:helix-turn-helix transcriptional regulator n=1 Tax=Lacibacter sp. H407 TaxID=3133423 RepID=UPI0030C1ADF0